MTTTTTTTTRTPTLLEAQAQWDEAVANSSAGIDRLFTLWCTLRQADAATRSVSDTASIVATRRRGYPVAGPCGRTFADAIEAAVEARATTR